MNREIEGVMHYSYTIRFYESMIGFDDKITMWFDGEQIKIDTIFFEFISLTKLTRLEVYNKIKGSYGIASISGDFRITESMARFAYYEKDPDIREMLLLAGQLALKADAVLAAAPLLLSTKLREMEGALSRYNQLVFKRVEDKIDVSDEDLLEIYISGFKAGFQTPSGNFINALEQKAFDLGISHAIIGDDVRSVDYLSEEEILNMIRKQNNQR